MKIKNLVSCFILISEKKLACRTHFIQRWKSKRFPGIHYHSLNQWWVFGEIFLEFQVSFFSGQKKTLELLYGLRQRFISVALTPRMQATANLPQNPVLLILKSILIISTHSVSSLNC